MGLVNRAFLVIALSICAIKASAHGSDMPLHGGIVKIVGEMSFELVALDSGTEVYLIDDGDPVDSSSVSVSIKYGKGDEKTVIDLEPGGANKFVASEVLPSSNMILVLVTLPDGVSRIGAKFSLLSDS
jgi:hypothetical protein